MSMACLANHAGSGLWVDIGGCRWMWVAARCSTQSVMTQHGRYMVPALRHHRDCPTHAGRWVSDAGARAEARRAQRRVEGFHEGIAPELFLSPLS